MPARSTGCLTCRKRKVRCDERRPGCEKCARHGVQCPGYVREQGAFEYMDQTTSTAERANSQYLKTTAFDSTDTSFEGSFLALGQIVTLPALSITPQEPVTVASPRLPLTLTSASADREQMYDTFIHIYNPKNVGPRSLGFDFMRMLAALSPSSLVLRDGLDALSLIQVGSAHADQQLLGEAVVRYGKALRGTREALSTTGAVEDPVLATVSVLAICEFFDHMKENPSAWLGHLMGFDEILLARGSKSLKSKLSMLLFFQSRFPALSRSLLRRKADPLSSPEWRAVLRCLPLGAASKGMELAMQVPELLERYDALDGGSPTVKAEAETLLSDCEHLDIDYQHWYTDSWPSLTTPVYATRSVEEFPTYAALVTDRTLSTGYHFPDQKIAFLHQQHWCCTYFLRDTTTRLHRFLQQTAQSQTPIGMQQKRRTHSTADVELDDLVFSLCRCIPGFAEPITGAHGHIAMFLPLRVATMHFEARQLWDWAAWVENVRARVFYKGIRPPAVKEGDYAQPRSLPAPGV